jgi:hypothetical protein
VEGEFDFRESKLEYAVEGNHNLKSLTKRVDTIRNHIYDRINTLEVEEFFATRFPLHPPLIQRIKDVMP